jgi:4'-phosphopantetheinyl transferase
MRAYASEAELSQLLGSTRSHGFLELEPAWSITSPDFKLSLGYVDLWRLQLNLPEKIQDRLTQVLSAEELTRADRFKFERDRRCFIAARAQLRTIVGNYLESDPRALAFKYEARGKPFLDAPIRFNITHSKELALVAIAHQRNVGVDLESIRAMKDIEKIANRFFSASESTELAGLEEVEQLQAFFRCWTLKEAWIKATGDGLSQPTESFDVAFGRDGPVRLLNVEGKPEEPNRWQLLGLLPAPGYIGALAVEGQEWELRCFDFIP